jgi:hypothetical protein
MKMNKLIAAALSVCMITGAAGWAGNTSGTSRETESKATETTKASESETETVVTETSESDTTTAANDYKDCIDACIWFLNSEKDHIKAVGKTFSMNELVGTSDLNGDGLPELYYYTEDEPGFSAKFAVRSYLPYAGEMADYIVIPNVIYQAGSGGGLLVYKTDKELILTTWGGEEFQTHYSTEVHSLKDFSLIASYSLIEYEDYNYDTGVSKFRYECKKNNGETITKEDYDKVIKDYVERTQELIVRNFDPADSDNEAPLKKMKATGLKSYEDAVEYFKSLS